MINVFPICVMLDIFNLYDNFYILVVVVTK